MIYELHRHGCQEETGTYEANIVLKATSGRDVAELEIFLGEDETIPSITARVRRSAGREFFSQELILSWGEVDAARAGRIRSALAEDLESLGAGDKCETGDGHVRGDAWYSLAKSKLSKDDVIITLESYLGTLTLPAISRKALDLWASEAQQLMRDPHGWMKANSPYDGPLAA